MSRSFQDGKLQAVCNLPSLLEIAECVPNLFVRLCLPACLPACLVPERIGGGLCSSPLMLEWLEMRLKDWQEVCLGANRCELYIIGNER